MRYARGTREARVHAAGWLVALGLSIQLGTLFWNHAISFMIFALVGSPLAGAGVAIYLHTIATRPPSTRAVERAARDIGHA